MRGRPPGGLLGLCVAVATAAATVLVAPAPLAAATTGSQVPQIFGISDPAVVTIRGTGNITTELARAVGTAASAERPLLVKLPAGKFTVKSTVTVRNHVYLLADPATTVTWAGGSGQMLWFSSVTSGVHGGTWDGARRSTANVFGVKASRVALENLTVRNAGKNGIAAYLSSRLTLRHVSATGNTKDGVYLEGSILDARSVRATKNRRNGIQLSSRSSGTISSSSLDSNGQAVKGTTTGKTGHGLGVASSQVSVDNTSMSSNKVCGASLTGTARVTISGSRMAGNGRHGLGTTAGSRAMISDTTVSSSGYNGVLASGSGTVIDLVNVSITGSRKHGLSVPTKGAATIANTVITTSGKVNASVSDRGRLTVGANNTFRSAKSHGIAVSSKGSLTISGQGNLVEANREHGLLVSKSGTTARITAPVRFVRNKRDAIHVNSKAKLSMVTCAYSGNAGKRVAKSGGRITSLS